MKTLILIIVLAISTIGFFLGFCLYRASGKIRNLEKTKANLNEDKAKLSDALRRKGIQIDRLLKEIKRLNK